MKKTLIAVSLLCTLSAFSQVKPEWKTPVEGSPNSINFHNFTQTPILETSKFYYGISAIDKKVTWSIPKSEAMAAMQTARTAAALTGSSDVTQGLDLEQYYEIPNTQFACINSNIVDVSSGKIILGEGNNPIKSLISNHIIPELNFLLLKVKDASGSEKLYAVDISTSMIVWSTLLSEANATKDAMKFVGAGMGVGASKIDLFRPAINGTNDIVYNNNGKLSLINSKTGVIMWENNCNPGTFFLNDDQSKIIVVVRPSSISLSAPKPFGKKVLAIDATTGKNLWAESIELDGTYRMYRFQSSNELLLAYNNGINLYDLKTGKKLWKKDFEANNLKNIEPAKDGLGIQYGNKITVIDPKTGQKVWKKPVELDGIDENVEYTPLTKIYDNTLMVIAPTTVFAYDKVSGDKKWSKGIDENARIGFDDKNKSIIIVNRKKIYLFKPDQQPKAPKEIEVRIENPSEIVGFEVKEKGYFIYGQKEYLLISTDGSVVVTKVYKQLKGNRAMNAGLLTASIASGIMGTEVTIQAGDAPPVDCGVFVDVATAREFQEISKAQADYRNQLKANDKKRRSVRTDDNYAYFVKGEAVNDKNVISMVIVDKSSGVESKTIDFSSDRDVVFEIDFNNGFLYYVEKGEFNIVKL